MQEKILDTFRCTDKRILYKDLHIQRVIDSFGFFHCLVDANRIIQTYQQIEIQTEGDCRVRVEFTIESDFKSHIETKPFQRTVEPMTLIPALYGQQLAGRGVGNFKTTDRRYWDQNLKAINAFATAKTSISNVDVVGINSEGFVTETSRFNLFFYDGHKFYTPTLHSGCLKGVFREHCLQNDGVLFDGYRLPLVEKDFSWADLKAAQVYVGNSVQGLLSAVLP